MPQSKDPCKAVACKIQKCLKGKFDSNLTLIILYNATNLHNFPEHNYQEGSCLDVLQEMKECCRKWGDTSLVCSGIKVDDSPKKNYE